MRWGLVVVAVAFVVGCASPPSGSTGVAGAPPDRAEGILGLPPLWFYEPGPDGYAAVPVLASYWSDRLHFLLLGVGSLGWTSQEQVAEGSEEGSRTTDWSFELAGLYNSDSSRTRTPSRVVDRRRHRFLWFVPIHTREEVRTATGVVRRSWLFGLIPLD